MLLYHYSKEQYDHLLTREAQGLKSSVQEEKSYSKHISFFFERPPLDIIGDIFGDGHHTWVNGNKLYEYIVDTSDIGKFEYSIVEFPEKTAILYDTSLTDAQYYSQIEKVTKEKGYKGSGSRDLEKAVHPLLGTTRAAYANMRRHPNFEELKKKYAATVPHVMIYPKSGQIDYRRVSQVTVGVMPHH